MDSLFNVLAPFARGMVMARQPLYDAALEKTQIVGLDVLHRLNGTLFIVIAADLRIQSTQIKPPLS